MTEFEAKIPAQRALEWEGFQLQYDRFIVRSYVGWMSANSPELQEVIVNLETRGRALELETKKNFEHMDERVREWDGALPARPSED